MATPTRHRRKPAPQPRPSSVDADAAATAQAVLALLLAPFAPEHAAAPAAEPAAAAVAPPPTTGPAHSRITCLGGNQAHIAWLPGQACPPALQAAAQRHTDQHGHLQPDDDAALPLLLRLAHEAGHALLVDDAVWALLAAHRDARRRLSALQAAYPDGPASAALQHLLRLPLPLFQAEGALFAVVAGRALVADERGLGKGVQAIAAAQLWRRHFGVQRVLVLCAPAQRLGWQRAWQRFAGSNADGPDQGQAQDQGQGLVQVIDGGHFQRQALWQVAADIRILAPDALQADGAHLAHWAPDLVIVDEPQQLALHADDWAALQAPHALVLCGAPLADAPALMQRLVAWLDTQRLGPLAALCELHAASDSGRTLADADVERLSTSLSRLMLQRLRSDVATQLPPLVYSERLLPLAAGQRAVHDQHLALAQRLLAAWQASGWCSDADQWRLAQALRGMQQACHRADPADAASALAEATLQAVAGQLADWAGCGAAQVAVLCPSLADQAQLAQRLGVAGSNAGYEAGNEAGNEAGKEAGSVTGIANAGVHLLAPGAALPAGVEAVLQIGVPWRPRRQPVGPRADTPPGQQWLHLVAQDSIDSGLFSTLASRFDVPRGPADGARDHLSGDRLQAWLVAAQAAVNAI